MGLTSAMHTTLNTSHQSNFRGLSERKRAMGPCSVWFLGFDWTFENFKKNKNKKINKKIHIRDEFFAEHINIFFFSVQKILKHYLEHGLCKAQNNNKLMKLEWLSEWWRYCVLYFSHYMSQRGLFYNASCNAPHRDSRTGQNSATQLIALTKEEERQKKNKELVILREKNWSEQGDVQSVVPPLMKTEGTIRSHDMGHFRISV